MYTSKINYLVFAVSFSGPLQLLLHFLEPVLQGPIVLDSHCYNQQNHTEDQHGNDHHYDICVLALHLDLLRSQHDGD